MHAGARGKEMFRAVGRGPGGAWSLGLLGRRVGGLGGDGLGLGELTAAGCIAGGVYAWGVVLPWGFP